MNSTGSASQGSSEKISGLVDARILYRNDTVLGLVDELLIDLNTGRVAYVIARRRDGRRASIPWDLLEYRGGDFRFCEVTSCRAGPSRLCADTTG